MVYIYTYELVTNMGSLTAVLLLGRSPEFSKYPQRPPLKKCSSEAVRPSESIFSGGASGGTSKIRGEAQAPAGGARKSKKY